MFKPVRISKRYYGIYFLIPKATMLQMTQMFILHYPNER